MSRRRSRPSTSRPPHGDSIPIEERPAREVTHVCAVAGHARRRQDPQSRLRRHAGPLHHGDRHREGHRAARFHDEPAAAVQRAAAASRVGVVARAHPRRRELVRRDRRGGRRRDRRARQALARPLQRHRLAGRAAPRVGRRRPRARLAPAPARHLRRARAGAGRRRHRLARSRRGRGDAGARPGRLAARRAAGGQVGGAVARAAARAGPSPRRPYRVADPPQRPAAAAGGRPGRLGRPHQPLPDARRRRIPPDRPHPRRRGGGGLRQGRQAPRPRVSGRAGDRSRVQGRQRSRLRPAAGQDHAQGSRHPDRSASARPASRRRSSTAPTSASAA